MNTRPVLAMNFYSLDQSTENTFSFLSPYQQMKRQAQTQKQQKIKKIQYKKKNAGKVMQNLNQKLNKFFPEQSSEQIHKQNVSKNQMTFSESNINQGKKMDKYSPEYFKSLHQNLKDINELIDALDIDQ